MLGVCIPVLFLLVIFFAILACRYRRVSDEMKKSQPSVSYTKEENNSPERRPNDAYMVSFGKILQELGLAKLY